MAVSKFPFTKNLEFYLKECFDYVKLLLTVLAFLLPISYIIHS